MLHRCKNNDDMICEFILQLGVMIPGWVRNTVPYGVFLEFPGKLCGLVPRRVGRTF